MLRVFYIHAITTRSVKAPSSVEQCPSRQKSRVGFVAITECTGRSVYTCSARSRDHAMSPTRACEGVPTLRAMHRDAASQLKAVQRLLCGVA